MTARAEHSRRKWVIIPVKVTGTGLYDIRHKIPANVSHCEGLMLSVVQKISDRDLKRCGELTLEINSQKVHPVHLTLDYNVQVLPAQRKTYALDESLNQPCYITGYYRDYSGMSYTMNIYLACRTKTQTP